MEILMHGSKLGWLVLALGLNATALAQTNTITLSDPRRISAGTGTATITSNPDAPDTLQLQLANLEPNVEHSVYLAASPFIGALPVQYLGFFRTAVDGTGSFYAVTEVMDAYLGANPAMTDKVTGIAPPAAGVLANGAFPIPLDWIRIYRAQPAPGSVGTVFSKNGAEPGGIHLISTDRSFNGDVQLVANAGPDISVRAPDFAGDASLFVLDGAASRGGIRSYVWTITESNLPTIPLAGCYSDGSLVKELGVSRFAPCSLFTPFNNNVFTGQPLTASQVGFKINGVNVPFSNPAKFQDLAGTSMTVQLTITDAAGNTSSDTLKVTLR
jgi:hypothetical protein